MRPDLVRDDGIGWNGVADTKYKTRDDAGKVSDADFYQLVTYARLDQAPGHLIHADGVTSSPPYQVRGTDAAIAEHRVDLTASPEDRRAEMSAFAATSDPRSTATTLRALESA